MSWPWISRKHHIARCEELTVANAVATSQRDAFVKVNADLCESLKKTHADLAAARAAGEECAHRLAACDQERKDAKASFATLANLSRQLETKLRDCEDPPITRKELEKLTKLIAVLRSENEGLKKHVTRSDDTIARLTKRLDSDGDEASA